MNIKEVIKALQRGKIVTGHSATFLHGYNTAIIDVLRELDRMDIYLEQDTETKAVNSRLREEIIRLENEKGELKEKIKDIESSIETYKFTVDMLKQLIEMKTQILNEWERRCEIKDQYIKNILFK